MSETDFNTDKESENTTTEKEDETTTQPKKTTKKTTLKPTTKKPTETKKAEQTKQKKEAVKTTAVPKMDKEEVLMKNALKQKELDDDDISTTIWTEETTAPTITEGSGEFAEAGEPLLLSQDTTLGDEEATTKKGITAKNTPAPNKTEKVEKKKDERKEKVEKKEVKEPKTEKPKVVLLWD